MVEKNNDKKNKPTESPLQVSAKRNITVIILYALGLGAALALNDLVTTIFNRYKLSHINEIISKVIYVILMFTAAVLVAYFSHSTVPL